MRILMLLASASVALWGMSNYANYLNSAFLAIMIVLACGPLVDGMRKRRVSRWINLLVTLVLVTVALVTFVIFLLFATAQFVETLPAYKTQAQALVQQVQTWLESMGLDSTGSAAVAGQTDASWALDFAASFLGALTKTIGNASTLVMLMIFLFVDVILFPGRLAWQGQHSSDYARRVSEFTGDLRQYIVVMVIIGAAIGALNTAWFYFIGVPQALLWGVLSGILNFIPFIGFWFGLIPPAILMLLASGPQQMIFMAVGYILVNAAVQNVIQPKLVVSRLNLTPFMSLLSATFWPLVLGPVGAIIGVPLTLTVHSLLLEPDPSTRWLAAMMRASKPAEAAPDADTAGEHPRARNDPNPDREGGARYSR
jgi:predicted PurR-regulated permease PerM